MQFDPFEKKWVCPDGSNLKKCGDGFLPGADRIPECEGETKPCPQDQMGFTFKDGKC